MVGGLHVSRDTGPTLGNYVVMCINVLLAVVFLLTYKGTLGLKQVLIKRVGKLARLFRRSRSDTEGSSRREQIQQEYSAVRQKYSETVAQAGVLMHATLSSL
eukprot:8606844-Heterocapsa_arctica.AAC.1